MKPFLRSAHTFAVLVALCLLQPIPAQAPRTQADSKLANVVVLIIRHGEKPDSDEDKGLTPAGQARAKAYVGYFQKYQIAGHPARPDYIFATADGKKSARERLTVAPLSQALKLPIDNRFANKDYQGVVDALRAKRYGSTVLICWHHGKIPDLIRAFGADPVALIKAAKWPADQFSWVVQLSFDGKGHLKQGETKLVEEHLMPSDH